MNKERILKIADVIEAEGKVKFNMSSWISECGTTACIAGFTDILFGVDPTATRDPGERFFVQRCTRLLDLNETDAWELFFAYSLNDFERNEYRKIGYEYLSTEFTSAEVVKALRWMMDSGTINWKIALTAIRTSL